MASGLDHASIIALVLFYAFYGVDTIGPMLPAAGPRASCNGDVITDHVWHIEPPESRILLDTSGPEPEFWMSGNLAGGHDAPGGQRPGQGALLTE